MKISNIEDHANRWRRRLGLPSINACVAVFHDGTHRSIRSYKQLQKSLENGGTIRSGLAVYCLAKPDQRLLGIMLVQSDLYRRRMLGNNSERAMAAAVDAGAAFGAWRQRQQNDPQNEKLLQVQLAGARRGTVEGQRLAAGRRREIVRLAREFWAKHPKHIGKYSRTACAVRRKWLMSETSLDALSESRISRIISEEFRHGELSDLSSSPGDLTSMP